MDKIKVNITPLMYERLFNDYQAFFVDENAPSFNAFLCDLIQKMYEWRRQKRKEYVSHIIGRLGTRDKKKAEEIADELLILNDTEEPFPLDRALSLRPSAKHELTIRSIEENELKSISLSSYVRLLLTDYLKLSASQREVLVHREEYDLIQDAIADSRMIKLIRENGESVLLRPYCIAVNAEQSFNYVVALREAKGTQPVSVHLFKFHQAITVTRNYFEFDKEDIKAIESAFEKDVAFLMGDLIDAEVLLDVYGLKYLKHMYYNRPSYEVKDVPDDPEHFRVCLRGTYLQIENFVFRMGEHAFVIQPLEMAKRLGNRFEAAAAHYAKQQKREGKSRK